MPRRLSILLVPFVTCLLLAPPAAAEAADLGPPCASPSQRTVDLLYRLEHELRALDLLLHDVELRLARLETRLEAGAR